MKVEKLCSIDGCGRLVSRRGLCQTHYGRLRRGEDLLAPVRVHARSSAESFELNTERVGDCLVWTGHRQSKGYGVITSQGRQVLAHRWAYERGHGPVPEGMYVDHICFNRACVEASHLRLATHAENEHNRAGANMGSTTGVRNVYPHGPGFRVQIKRHGKNHMLGTYRTVEEAAAVAEAKRAELFGEFAGRG